MCDNSKKNINSYITVKPYLRKEREAILEEMQSRHNAFIRMIDGWDMQKTQDFTKKDMKAFPIMEWKELKEGVKIRRRRDVFNGVLCFDTIMNKGTEFGWHLHSDCNEMIDVVEGCVSDLLSNESENYKEGQNLEIKKGVPHSIVALEDSKIMVYFD